MSFLSGILDIGKSAIQFLSGNSISGALARTAILGYAVNKLSKNAIKGNSTGTDNIDKGVRLQIEPNAESKIPVLYGSAFFGGNITDAAMTNNNKTMWYCLVLSEKTGNLYSTSSASDYTFNNIYWNDQRIIFNSDGITANYTVDRSGNIDRSVSGLVKVYCYKGGYNQGTVPSGYTGTVPNATTLFPNWTVGTHAMSNLVFALVRVDYNRERNITGLGNMLFHVTNTMKLPGDVVYDYLTNTTYGAGISSGDILTTDITALNTYAGTSVAYDDQGTGAQTLANRYQINGVIDTANPVLENAESILSSAASWLSYDAHEGNWGIVINKSGTSIASFDDSNILGSVSVGGTGLGDLYNKVKVAFPHRDLRDSADFVTITINPLDRNANEEDNTLEITYDIINEPIQAQLLGFIELKQSRIDKVIKFQTDFSQYNLKAGDIIDVTNSKLSFSSKLFRIISINEIQDDAGALLMDITALEYDSGVYSTADLYRYTRSDANGIITIGSIGTPGTPTVTKYEIDARPRVVISTTAPTGVVEGIEYWITTDVSTVDDNLRSYTLIATKRPTGGGVYTSGTTVTIDYDQLNATNFYIKTRGFNTTAVGPYSTPSGLVEFAPTQVTDGIGPDTGVFNSTGGLLTALAAIELLKKIDDLLGGNAGKSILDGVLDFLFPDRTTNKTAAELLQEDTQFLSELGGTINDLNNISIDELLDVDTTSTPPAVNDKLVWNGSNWVPSGASEAGAAIVAWGRFMLEGNEMLLDSSFNLDTKVEKVKTANTQEWKFSFTTAQPGNAYVVLTSVGNANNFAEGTGNPTNSQVLTSYNHTTKDFILHADSSLASGNVVYVAVVGVTGVAGANLLAISARTPADRTTQANPLNAGVSSDEVNIDDEISITYSVSDVYSIAKGSGNARLYKSNGTLAATLPASNVTIVGNKVTLPFPNRDYGTDYYILMDRGVVTGQGEGVTYLSPSIGTPTFWNFHTKSAADPEAAASQLPTQGVARTIPAPGFKPTPITCANLIYLTFKTQSNYQDQTNQKVHRQSLIRLVFNNPIKLNSSGTITIASSAGTHQAINIAHTFSGNKVSELLWVDNKELVINPTKDFTPGATYWLTITANCVSDTCGINGNEAILDTSKIRWTVDPGPKTKTTSV